jgi:hypothetical protein
MFFIISTECLKPLQQVITEISFGEKNVTIEILRENLLYSMCRHNIPFELVITPQATVITTDSGMTVTLSYNIQYNLTMLGRLCGYTSSVSFSYGELWRDHYSDFNNSLY